MRNTAYGFYEEAPKSRFETDLYPNAETEENNGELSIHMNIPSSLVSYISDNTKKIAEEEIKKLVRDHILKSSYSYSLSSYDRPLQTWVKDLVKEMLQEDRQLIIEKAAHELSASMKRSKIVREKFAEMLETEEDDLK